MGRCGLGPQKLDLIIINDLLRDLFRACNEEERD